MAADPREAADVLKLLELLSAANQKRQPGQHQSVTINADLLERARDCLRALSGDVAEGRVTAAAYRALQGQHLDALGHCRVLEGRLAEQKAGAYTCPACGVALQIPRAG